MDKERPSFDLSDLSASKEGASDGKTSKKRKNWNSVILSEAKVDIKESPREAPPEKPKEHSQERPHAWFHMPKQEAVMPANIPEEKPAGHVESKETAKEDDEVKEDGTLTDDGKKKATSLVAAKHKEAVQSAAAENENPESVEALTAKATALADEILYEKIESSGDMDVSIHETAELAGITLDPAELNTESGQEADDAEDLETGETGTDLELDDELNGMEETHDFPQEMSDGGIILGRSPEGDSDAEDDPLASSPAGTATPVSPATPPTMPGMPTGPVAGGGIGGPGGGLPPVGGGFGPGGPGGGGGGLFGPNRFTGLPGRNLNVAPARANAPDPNRNIDDKGHPAVFFVAGAVVGYFMGKKRWKRKGKEELKKVEKKLNQQIEDISWQLKAKESQLHKAVAEKVRQEGPAYVETLEAKKASIKKAPSEISITQPTQIETAGTPEQLEVTRQKAPEANILHTTKAPEHIGQVLMTSSEALAPVLLPRAEMANNKPSKEEMKQAAEQAKPVISEKAVETLSRAELLQLSEQIIVEGSSLRQIYETNLVGERGLRRLVAEHLRGGDLAKALKQEIVEREIDFERDPVMRDIAPASGTQGGGNSGGSAGASALDQMVQQAAAKLPAASEEAAFYKAKAAYEVEQSNKNMQKQRVVDISFTLVITSLLAAVVYMFLTRG